MNHFFKICHKEKILIALIISFVIQPVSAENIDLIKLYYLAESADTTLQAAKANQRAIAQKLPQARAVLLPNASLSANSSKNTANTSPSTYSSQSYTLTLTQPIFHMDQWLELQKAGFQVQQAWLNLAASQQELMVRDYRP